MTETTLLHARESRGFTLKQILGADAATCLAFGVLLVAAATPLASLLGLPESLLFFAGLVLLPCAALMLMAARKPSAPLVWTVIAGNAAWVVASIVVIFAFELTALGMSFVAAQAAAVVALLVLEWRARPAHI